MDRCGSCDKPMRQGQVKCSCGWAIAGKKYVDPRYGYCSYNDHGNMCRKPGSISLTTIGEDVWYCSEHALGLKGMASKKSKISIKDYMASIKESEAERKAIQEG